MAGRGKTRLSTVGPRRRYRLRRALLEDLPVLLHHRVEMFRAIGHHTPDQLRSHAAPYGRWLRPRLRSGTIVAFVATEDGRPVGSGAIWFMPQQPRPGLSRAVTPYILSMYTDPDHQRQGIASAIVKELVRVARTSGAQRVTLHAADQGRPVYERLGFEPANEMRLWLRRPSWVEPTRRTATTRGPAGSRRSGRAGSGTGRRRSRSRPLGRSGHSGRS
ncbi:MAG: GNAT family N-acetyltransferase [Thermoplasmata archaeon]|jgi:GNAT superfamily N-acetyltransferase|nr:GNAT family N-acetyltransferase [Thermoplasmata archaeon]